LAFQDGIRKHRDAACINIQKVYRGHKGREALVIEAELVKLDQIAKPLILMLREKEDALERVMKVSGMPIDCYLL
jgi:hypothetical protein